MQRSNTLQKHLYLPIHTPFFPSKGQYYHATGLEREPYANLVTSLQRWIPKAGYHTSKYTAEKKNPQKTKQQKTSEIILTQNTINMLQVVRRKKQNKNDFAMLRSRSSALEVIAAFVSE